MIERLNEGKSGGLMNRIRNSAAAILALSVIVGCAGTRAQVAEVTPYATFDDSRMDVHNRAIKSHKELIRELEAYIRKLENHLVPLRATARSRSLTSEEEWWLEKYNKNLISTNQKLKEAQARLKAAQARAASQ